MQNVADYEAVAAQEDAVVQSLQYASVLAHPRRKQDSSIKESLRARRTRLLAFLAFLYPIHATTSSFIVNGVELPERQLLRRDGWWIRRSRRCLEEHEQ